MKKFAEKELELILNGVEDEDGKAMQAHINRDIMELIEVFSEQGHSGTSASYVRHMFDQLSQLKPIAPLTGADDEWQIVEDALEKVMEQNKRCSSVFRFNHDNETAYDIDGVVYSDDGGETYFSGGVHSPKSVTFPYVVPSEPEKVMLDE